MPARFHGSILFLSGLLFTVISARVSASPRFDQTRVDQLVPAKCRDLDIQNFNPQYKTVFYGISGSVKHGFNFEWPISRDEASILWAVFKARAAGTRDIGAEGVMTRNAGLRDEYELIERFYRPMGFDFKKEGDVLEILSLIALKNQFPPNQFFVTGGYAYHDPGQRILGELDILVGRISDCQIIVVGESKLGIGALSHAREQIRRFGGWIMGRLTSNRSFIPQVRVNSQGIPRDQYGYVLDYDEDAMGRAQWSYFGR